MLISQIFSFIFNLVVHLHNSLHKPCHFRQWSVPSEAINTIYLFSSFQLLLHNSLFIVHRTNIQSDIPMLQNLITKPTIGWFETSKCVCWMGWFISDLLPVKHSSRVLAVYPGGFNGRRLIIQRNCLRSERCRDASVEIDFVT